mmetsp:Transcript_15957/g.29216  ORF Transcript_15957/g.29216 Transcript_15957/m.29216 type:complete len:202 (-) Transcript_15957:307-912(-)
MRKDRLHRAQGLYDSFGDLLPKVVDVVPLVLQHLKGRGQASLMADIVSLRVVIEYEVGVVFVDSIVGEVHAHIPQVSSTRDLVLLSSEPRKAFSMNVNSKRVAASDKHIDPHVELEVVDEERLVKVALSYESLRAVNVIEAACQKDPSSLARSFRLDYESFVFDLAELPCEVYPLAWEQPSLRVEVVVLREQLPHSVKVSG